MGSTAEAGGSQTLSTVTEDLKEWLRSKGFEVTSIVTADPPAGQTDLFVYQPNPRPGRPTLANFSEWTKALDYWVRNYFVLPPQFQPISGVSGLLIAARRACAGGLKLRQLRIMGHGHDDHFMIGHDAIYYKPSPDLWGDYKTLLDDQGRATEAHGELKKLAEHLDPSFSLVVIDCCLFGQNKDFVAYLSELWGGVAVRAYQDFQYWESEDMQIGHSSFMQCARTACHRGIEVLKMEKQ
jgi:hypothetical protein